MCRFDTGKFRHRDIQHNDVRVKSRRFEKQFLAIGHGTHHLEVGLQQRADPFSDGTMVIGKQYAWPIQYFLRSPSSPSGWKRIPIRRVTAIPSTMLLEMLRQDY